MRCPYCQHADSKVVDTRKVGSSVRRRRECLECGQRFTTYERLAAVSLFVVKRDGRREPFDREKLLDGIQKACTKRPISQETIQHLVSEIENQLFAMGKAEVESKHIGQMVMDQLRSVDDVAYVRFASVYMQFEDVSRLAKEIREFEKWKEQNVAIAQQKRKPSGQR